VGWLNQFWSYLIGLEWKLGMLTAFGSALLYARWSHAGSGQIQVKALGFESLIKYLPLSVGQRRFVSFLIFVMIGGIVGMVMAEPLNGRQAIAAGFGWTALLGNPAPTAPAEAGAPHA
jgi:uncharacterized membrane protein YbjE (DUF340 family)